MFRSRAGWIAVAAAVLAIGVVAVIVLQSGRQRAGVNNVPVSGAFARLRPGRQLCQGGEIVAGDAAVARFYLGTPGSDVAHVHVLVRDDDGAVVAQGSASGPPGFLPVSIEPPGKTVAPATVCLQNTGDSVMEVGGLVGSDDPSVTIAGRAQPGRARIDYFRGGSDSKAAVLPLAAHRFGLGKAAWIGTWTFWLLLVLVIGALALAAVTAARALRGEA